MHTRHLTTAAGGVMLFGAMLFGAPAASAQDDQNCDDFASQADAQAHYRADTTDPDGLDRDDDGLACEDHPGYAEGSATDMQPVGSASSEPPADDQGGEGDDGTDQMVMPKGGVETGGGSTEGIENGRALAAGGLALTLGAGGIIAATRRRDRA